MSSLLCSIPTKFDDLEIPKEGFYSIDLSKLSEYRQIIERNEQVEDDAVLQGFFLVGREKLK